MRVKRSPSADIHRFIDTVHIEKKMKRRKNSINSVFTIDTACIVNG